ncbi:stage II sporulation protein D [Candidatus Soleaferrea massiliensis]|uniref:stage II sporulation protein D n=1 Tax=Candidatus Soleaferrea massiliensis TaxID=1470354 RepID=UPI00058C7119|nr:stage II sporulation protein D [Candidatus Soleaferrea massiliensis]
MKSKVILAAVLIFLIAAIPILSINFGAEQTPPATPHTSSGDMQNQGNADTVIKTDGYFNILDASTGKVNKVSERDYVRGAVACEMPASYHTEALKAQAVAAHTYALRLREQQKQKKDETLKGADFSADPSNLKGYMTETQAKQFFGSNFELRWSKITEAADAVLKECLVYEEQPIIAAYHAISFGKTEQAENVWSSSVPYLVAVDSEGDKLSPDYASTVKLTADEVKTKLTAKFPDIKLGDDCQKWFTDLTRSDSGTVLSLKAGGQETTGKELREVFGLRSADFEISYADGSFTFQVVGYGHAVGLSQYGADYMARQGSSYRDILLHYYQNVQIAALDIPGL